MAQQPRGHPSYERMRDSQQLSHRGRPVKVVLSYVLDWIVLVVIGIASAVIDTLEPRKRPFSLSDPNISLPYSRSETVPLWLLGILAGAVPVVTILLVTLILVPGSTTPRHTPTSLIWRRKLWEFHACTLGFITAHVLAFFFTQGMKNLFGQLRPDLLDRCQPDLVNRGDYAVGGGVSSEVVAGGGQLYSASICQQKDMDILDDGFRSFPSGHSSASAAGLVYLSLLLASKLTAGTPFADLNSVSRRLSHAAFPSRRGGADPLQDVLEGSGSSKSTHGRRTESSAVGIPVRILSAAPPLYLLIVVLAPFALSIYISASRWFDYRHHGFDILFGYLIGLLAAVFSFQYYHLPISGGGGWAWGPRSREYAFWAGIGRVGFASRPVREHFTPELPSIPEQGSDGQDSQWGGSNVHASGAFPPSAARGPRDGGNLDEYFDVEMQRLDHRA